MGALISISLVFLLISLCDYTVRFDGSLSREGVASSELDIGIIERFRLTIVYDNNPSDERLVTAWGFGCYINADNVTILFDTGGDPEILLKNMAELNLDLKSIDVIVLSHIHGDHVGGLFGFLEVLIAMSRSICQSAFQTSSRTK